MSQNSSAILNAKQKLYNILYALLGCFLFAVGMNLLIMPLGLYNSGFMGIAQLFIEFVRRVLGIMLPDSIDFTGIMYFLINVPLFFLGYKVLGRDFTLKSLLNVTMLSLFLVIVPIPKTPIVDDYLTACILGGIIAGFGEGLVLRAGTSAGGQDILGLVISKYLKNFSVGKLSILLNIFVYAICLLLFDIQIVIYSLIYTTVLSMAIDRVHIQNINMGVMIFTKKEGVETAIMSTTGRGVTRWEGCGAFTNEASHILYIVVSKYEKSQIQKIIHSVDSEAFIIYTEGCYVDGNFEKRL